MGDVLKSNTALVKLDLSGEDKRNNTRKASINNPLFSFFIKKQATALEKQEQHHWVKYWNQTQHSLNSIWVVGINKQHKWHPPTIHSLTSRQQQTGLEKEEQHHWVRHWNQTRHLQNSTWVVKTGETTHKWHPSTTYSLFDEKTVNNIKETGVISLSDALKLNTTLTQLNLCREHKKKQHIWHTSTIYSFYSHKINRQRDWRKRYNIIEWCIEIKHNTHGTHSKM